MAQQNHQPKIRGWAIRDDGMLYPAIDAILRKPNFRPYHGDINAPLEQRMRYLQGFTDQSAAKLAAEQGTFNIATAGKDELLDFMLDEYGHQLDGRQTIENLRNQAVLFIQQNKVDQAEASEPEPATVEAPAPAPAPKRARKAAGMKIPKLGE